MRVVWLIGTLVLAFIAAVWSLQTPAPVAVSAPAAAFSAERAMVDVREIAQRPHPIGSPDHARVQTYLLARMKALGLQTSTHETPLTDGADRYRRQTDTDPASIRAVNLIGVLPGRDPALPAVVLMAHYDTTPRSPGAADDSAGVAAVLEAVRALQARGPADRTLMVLLTDAEELALDGAAGFFADPVRRAPIGFVINLEARGGGGRAAMFETGRGNAETIAAYAQAASRFDGGASATSLSVFLYERMPNGTDFTFAKKQGLPGVNIAFIGRPAQYHTPLATPDNLDQGALQHLGSQTLETADVVLRDPALPRAGQDAVYADLFGWLGLIYAPAIGWAVLAAAAFLFAAAVWRGRRAAGLTLPDLARGAADGLLFLSAAVVLGQAVRAIGGPQATSSSAYYTLMARLHWLEAGVTLAVFGLGLVLIGGRLNLDRRLMIAALAIAAAATALGGINPVVFVCAVVAIALVWFTSTAPRSIWGAWLGLIALGLLMSLAAQALAPPTAPMVMWPTLIAALAAAVSAFIQPALTRPSGLIAPALAAVVGVAWLMGVWHSLFLGVGMDLPGAVALPGLLILMLLRPLSPESGRRRVWLYASAALIGLGLIVSAAGWLAVPTLPPMN